jgi:arylsulfatase A-like enzyme
MSLFAHCILSLVFLHTLCMAGYAEQLRKPNIVFILADDLGYGDLGCYGQKKIRTPNIDRLASEGMRFTQHYAGNPVCAPSRCVLLTGKHCGHAAIRDNAEAVAGREGQQPMPRDTVTVAQLLKKAGYRTGIVGKWGLGMPDQGSGPNDFGFDYSYGYLCQRQAHSFYPSHLWRNGLREPLAGNPGIDGNLKGPIGGGETYSHDLMATDALRFVRENKDAPFFLYLAFTIPHLSLQVPDDSIAEYRGKWPETPYDGTRHYAAQPEPRAAYAAMISRMDRDVGRLLALLKELALDENTIVLFSSDNGAVFALCGTDPKFFESNGPLRGYKQDLFEGGIRVPLLARWPGKIQAGSVSDHASAFCDLMPTLCELAGIETPATDGISYLPALLGKPGQKAHEFLYWEYHGGGGAIAVRMGDWKALRLGVKKSPDAPVQLYNLADVIGESRDVAAEHPELVAKAREIMTREHTPSPVPRWNF